MFWRKIDDFAADERNARTLTLELHMDATLSMQCFPFFVSSCRILREKTEVWLFGRRKKQKQFLRDHECNFVVQRLTGCNKEVLGFGLLSITNGMFFHVKVIWYSSPCVQLEPHIIASDFIFRLALYIERDKLVQNDGWCEGGCTVGTNGENSWSEPTQSSS